MVVHLFVCCVCKCNTVSIVSLGIAYLVLYYCIIVLLLILLVIVQFIRNLSETVKFQ